MFKRKRIITTSDRAHLLQTIRSPRNVASWPHFTEALRQELDAAIVVEPNRIAADVVTMYSTVRLVDIRSGTQEIYTLVGPHEADLISGKLSVLTTLGTAILGRRAGRIVRVPAADGTRLILIETLLRQPETAHYAPGSRTPGWQLQPRRYHRTVRTAP